MADNPFGQIGGFLSSLIDPSSEQTQTQDTNKPKKTKTRDQVTTTPEAQTTTAIATTPTSTTATPTSTSESSSTTTTSTSISSPTTIQTTTSATSRTSSIVTSTSAALASSATASATPAQSSSSVNGGAIAGGVVGGLAVLALLAFGILWLLRRGRRKIAEKEAQSAKGPYEGSVVSLVAYGRDNKADSSWLDSTRPSTVQEPWDAESIRRMPSARLERKPVMNSGPAIFVTDENNNRRDICELPGSEPEPQMFRSELESGQKYHAYRPKPS